MIVKYYRWQVDNFINQSKELPEGITNFEIIEVDENPIVRIEVPQIISRAEFYYGLDLQNVTAEIVMPFIDNIPDLNIKRKARTLFSFATEFESFNDLLKLFIPSFNQYLKAIGKEQIDFDLVFINGKKLNE